ncbi:MAG TPA: hypothetical protein H9774_11685 [Candidatus Desulfovibrio gallistercoris]|nr:hypothetical protein [Candidatus Desulfovibrio gallistercoris]
MADLVTLNFKVEPDVAVAIQREMGIHDLSRSEFIRQCVRIATPLLRGVPSLLEADEKRVTDLMEKCGNILVILGKI